MAAVNSLNPDVYLSSRYLLFGSTSGWANQLKSLEHAYWIASATNRTLVLPPVLHHFDATQWTYNSPKAEGGPDPKTIQEIDPVSVYYDGRIEERSRMTSVLDFHPSAWNNSVSVIDYEVFRRLERDLLPNKTWPTKVFDKSLFSCEHIKYTLNHSLHGTIETAPSCEDHVGLSKQQPHTYTYQHIATSRGEYDDFGLWSYQFVYPNALFDMHSFTPSAFELHYTAPIRAARRELVRSWGYYGHYAAVHIRAGDGPYRKRNWTAMIPNLIESTYKSILDYVGRHRKSLTIDGSDSHSFNITLAVISDSDTWNERSTLGSIWKKEADKLVQRLRANESSIHLNIAHGNDQAYRDMTKTLKEKLGGNAEAGVYFDQLLAACADISFTGSEAASSTFQQRVRSMRNQKSSPCL